MHEFVQITTTTGDRAIAEQIATDLVDRRMAACVQIGGPVRSTFRWQGKIETNEEFMVTAKTTGTRTEAVLAAILLLHPYDVPEVIVLPIVGGTPSYLDWLRAEVSDTSSSE